MSIFPSSHVLRAAITLGCLLLLAACKAEEPNDGAAAAPASGGVGGVSGAGAVGGMSGGASGVGAATGGTSGVGMTGGSGGTSGVGMTGGSGGVAGVMATGGVGGAMTGGVGGAMTGGMGGAMTGGMGGGDDATFTDVYSIISMKCGGGMGCHVMGESGGLNMQSQALAYMNLVGVASEQCDGETRVVASNAEESLIIKALEGTACEDMEQMPRGRDPLSADEIDTIRSWIAAGAMDN